MKTNTYKIISFHSVYVDNYEEGEQENVNNYTLEREIKAETPKQAIEKYFEDFLYYDFNFSDSLIDEEENILNYSVLVDAENVEASDSMKELWKKGQVKLYSNNIQLELFELTKCKI